MGLPADSVVLVRMAEMRVVKCTPERPIVLKTTLGSCVGIILADRRSQVYGLAHVMLPENTSDNDMPGKYADSAVPALVSLMERCAGGPGGPLEAFLIGGASMFAAVGMADIGARNVRAAQQAVRKLNIPVVFDDTGGNRGRTVVFDCRSVELAVKTLNRPELSGRERER